MKSKTNKSDKELLFERMQFVNPDFKIICEDENETVTMTNSELKEFLINNRKFHLYILGHYGDQHEVYLDVNNKFFYLYTKQKNEKKFYNSGSSYGNINDLTEAIKGYSLAKIIDNNGNNIKKITFKNDEIKENEAENIEDIDYLFGHINEKEIQELKNNFQETSFDENNENDIFDIIYEFFVDKSYFPSNLLITKLGDNTKKYFKNSALKLYNNKIKNK